MSTYLGIDIGTTAVKVAVIRTAYRKVQLAGLASVEVAQAGGTIAAIAAAVRGAMGNSPGFGDAIATAIEGQRGTVRVLGLPANAAKQIDAVLPFELEAVLPFELSESVFDYRVLPGMPVSLGKGDKTDKADKTEPRDKADKDKQDRPEKKEELAVLVGVAKTVDVVARIDLVKAALSVEPERVGLGAFPITNLVPYLPGFAEGTVAVLDLGTVSSDVAILKSGEPVFARTLSLGTKGLPGTADKLARELRTTLAGYRSQGGETPSAVYLCGGGAYVAGAEAFLSSALKMEVRQVTAPALEAPTLSPEQASSIARYAKAIGLALGFMPRSTGLNLRKGPLAFERGFAWVKEKVPLLAGLAAVLLVSFLFSAWAQLYAKSKEKTVLESALGQVTKEILGEETQVPSRAQELVTSQTSLNDEDPMPHADAFDVMVRLSEIIPTTMVHDIEELDVQKGHAIVHGVVGTIPDTEAITTSLAKDPCFAGAKVTRTTAQVGGDRQKYVLEFDIKCPEDQKGAKKSGTSSSAASAAAPSASGGK
jgi:general secretion pathway protein L